MFKDLERLVQQSEQEHNLSNQVFEKLRNKPFWIWDIEEHKQEAINTTGDCCFNHIIGLPTKEKLEKPIFDYEKLLYYSLFDINYYNPLHHTFKHKHLWVKKSTGLGVTEFFLRLMTWLCLRNKDYRNSQMCIVTGPNIDIAIKLIKRMKSLFERKLGLTFANKETVLELNGCRIMFQIRQMLKIQLSLHCRLQLSNLRYCCQYLSSTERMMYFVMKEKRMLPSY
jgi:hypothetical protein